MARSRKALRTLDPDPHDEARVEHTVALPRPSLYRVTFKDGEDEKKKLVFARFEAEARNGFPGMLVLETSQLIYGEDPKYATALAFLAIAMEHSNLEPLMHEIMLLLERKRSESEDVVMLVPRRKRRR